MDAVEREASAIGWAPKDEFKGDPDKWVDAATYLERGKTVMPILKASNKRLEGEAARLSAEVSRLTQLFAASQESIQALQEAHSEATKQAVERAKAELRAQIKLAREEGDVDAELAAQDKLDDLRQKPPAAKPNGGQGAPDGGAQLDPEFVAWVKENDWYGKDARKTMKAAGIAQQLRADPDNDHLVGKAFYDRVLELMEPGGGRPQGGKVEGGRSPSGGGGGGGGKGYASLPPDAKEACDRQGKKLVGEGRAFKDAASWQAYYAKMYFEQGE